MQFHIYQMNFEAINLRHIYSSFKIHKVKIEAADELNVALDEARKTAENR